MFDIGASELLVVVAVAIVVVAPKDLPKMLRTVGFYVGKAKRMMNDVQKQMNDVMHQAEIEAMREDINKSVLEAEKAMKLDAPQGEATAPANATRPEAAVPDIPAPASSAQLREAELEKRKTEPQPAPPEPVKAETGGGARS